MMATPFPRFETLGLVNGICLLALAFLACAANALRLRRRFRAALEREVEQRKQAEQEARAADGAKGRFLAGVSHEIRTPMNGILGMTELLLGSGLNPSQREQVKLVRTSAQALLALVDDVLDLARVTQLGDVGRIVRRQDRRKLRVLVVDDRAANRAVAQGMLEALGYGAETVESGEEALARCAEQPFDAVLLDSEMPGLDGRETCRRLRRRETGGRHVPVIAVTAHTRPEEHEACRAAGMDDCLVKPFQAADLAVLLDRWIGIEAADGLLEERLEALDAIPAGPDMRTQVIEAFLQQGGNDLATMRRALLQRDGAALAEAAHGLHGSAAVLGARNLAESAGELAALARQGNLEGCTARLPRVESDFRNAAGKAARRSETRPNGPGELSPGLSEAMPWV